MLYDPGRDMAERYPDWTIATAPLPGAHAAVWPRRRLMVIASGQSRTEWRACVAHEIVHLDRGDTAACSTRWHERRLERQVDREAARRLIPIDAFIDALRWTNDDAELAEILAVDLDTLHVRSSTLSPAEVTRVERELWDEWRSA